MAWTRIADANQLQDDEAVPVTLGSAQYALFRSAGEFHLTDNVCTHQYALLSDGYVEDGCVECPLHGSRFRLEDGSVERGPSAYPQPVYETRVQSGRIAVRAA